jgi:hypothetical protein
MSKRMFNEAGAVEQFNRHADFRKWSSEVRSALQVAAQRKAALASAAKRKKDFLSPDDIVKMRAALKVTKPNRITTKVQPGERLYTGKPAPVENILTRDQTGHLAENIVTAYLRSKGLRDTRTLNVGKNNAPVDLVQDFRAIEVKGGQVSNTKGAQQWRASVGEVGEKEKGLLKVMPPEAKSILNAIKLDMVIQRKENAVKQLTQELKRPVKGETYTVILNPDTHRADIYRFDGFHKVMGWNKKEAKAAYVESVNYTE